MKKILVPTDFSDNANMALQFAVLLAQKTGAEIILLNVYDVPVENNPLLSYTDSKVAVKKCMKQYIPAEIPQSYLCEQGKPVNLIPEVAKKIQADLITMGIRGSKRLSKLIIGSTATAVIRNAKIPAFIIPENTELALPDKILFAFDGKEIPTKPTIFPLKHLASLLNSEILTLNVINELELSLIDKKFITCEADLALGDTIYSMHFSVNSDVLEGINEFINNHKVNAVAMIYHPIGFFNRIFMESRAHKMAFYTKKPLLVLPEIKD